MTSRSYLDVIVPDVRRRLAERQAVTSPADLRAAVARLDRAPASFASALARPGVQVIAEVKRYSPSKGAIRPDLSVPEVVAAYEKGGAAAISVLTEEDHFRGSLADLQAAAASTARPLLRKDFVIDPFQVYEARLAGASAVLLIAPLLDDAEVQTLMALARSLGLDVLLEVHDTAEMERALEADGVVIGINNRDLRTFEVTLETSLRLAGMVPADRLVVAESGIRGRGDVELLGAAGVDAVLVGESLLRQGEAAAAVAALTAPPCPAARRPGDLKTKESR